MTNTSNMPIEAMETEFPILARAGRQRDKDFPLFHPVAGALAWKPGARPIHLPEERAGRAIPAALQAIGGDPRRAWDRPRI